MIKCLFCINPSWFLNNSDVCIALYLNDIISKRIKLKVMLYNSMRFLYAHYIVCSQYIKKNCLHQTPFILLPLLTYALIIVNRYTQTGSIFVGISCSRCRYIQCGTNIYCLSACTQCSCRIRITNKCIDCYTSSGTAKCYR